MEFINIKDCYKIYRNGVTAVAGLNLKINRGEFVFIIGTSGSGKSSIVKMLYREEKPSKGEVMVAGINVAKLRNNKVYKLRRRIGIVFQDFKLLPNLNVYENVAFPLESFGLKKSEIKEKVQKALNHVGLKEKYRSFPRELSGGEQQRVCIARAIVNEPKLLICDEPTGNLDSDTAKGIMSVLSEINKDTKTTVIMATHSKEIVNRMKKRVICIEDGILVSDEEKGSYKTHENTKAA